MLVEVCANSLESAVNGQKAGADRVELCSELGVGGITPSHGLIEMVKDQLDIPVHVLIRPRSGHFTYSDSEFEVMKRDIIFCKQIGVEGIVSGVLHSNFTLDVGRTEQLISLSKPLKFTFHRAFDWVTDPRETFVRLENLGADYILSSGSEVSAEKGLDLLSELNTVSKKCTIMAGGGIRIENALKFKSAKLKALHLSGTSFDDVIDISTKVSMNSKAHLREGHVAISNSETIGEIVKSVK